jgi:glycosyltransferase involved in cell wall biosynthesis
VISSDRARELDVSISAVKMLRPSRARTWVLVAGGFHRSGGMDAANAALATHLADRGSKVHLVCHRADEDLRKHKMVEVHHVERPAGSFFLGQWLINSSGRRVARDVLARDASTRIVVNGGNCNWPDINWVHYVHRAWREMDTSGPRLSRAKLRLDKSVALVRERRALVRAQVVIANSNRTRDDLINLVGVPAERVHTVYLGSEPHWRSQTPEGSLSAREWLGKPADRPLVAFIGSLGFDSRKGFDTLWEAWQKLCAHSEWDVDLVVAGGGRALPVWQARVAEAGLGSRVSMLGHTDRIYDVLAASDLLVSPVRYEPYGLNVQEALCCGIPAMVSASAGVAERYPADLRDLLIPEPTDVDGLVVRMLGWRSTMNSWRQRVAPLARQLRARTWEAMSREIVEMVEDARPVVERAASSE